ncbi:MAG TPA: hypothetical protein VFE90_21390, partial [Myxococcales bacterium]|nr:hypothetical protein [Myxococcales bacterium]
MLQRNHVSLFASAVVILAAACTHSGSNEAGGAPTPAANMSTTPPSPDPRIGLKPGDTDAGQAIWNL